MITIYQQKETKQTNKQTKQTNKKHKQTKTKRVNTQRLCNVSLQSLLYGDDTLSLEDNLLLFEYVECYIYETERFK